MKFRFSLPVSLTVLLAASLCYAVNIKDVPFNTPNVGKVIFSHNNHFKAEGIKTNCKVCHNAIFNMKKKVRFTMTEMEKGKSCGACHNGKNAFKTDECLKCHPVKEITYKVKDTGDVKFSHELHTGMYKCNDCHAGLYLASSQNKRRTMAEMEAAQSCGACHDDKSAFTVKENCDRCHKM